LHDQKYQPSDLLHRCDEVLADWSDLRGKITAERVRSLLGRGMAMGVALEKWLSVGIWILTRADSEYPERLRRLIGQNAPAVLFGVGDTELLNAGGLAVVGSRDVSKSDKEYAQTIAAQAAREGLNVVSGGARGTDEAAMYAALEVEGTALGILANDLLKVALSAKWRKYIKGSQLCLVSSYYPEAGFQVGNAMGRNKYIYCLSDFALVVRSNEGKGGTWAGATENLKNHWAPLHVQGGNTCSGNVALAKLGASPLLIPDDDVQSADEWLTKSLQEPCVSSLPRTDASREKGDLFYSLFEQTVRSVLATNARVTLRELKELLRDLTQQQIVVWLDRAVDEGFLERPGKRRVYVPRESASTQRGLFDGEQ
jgi:predicted Rossmann fold nucleotide-binding protein DprA/Smf involved in DNA uptake